MTRTIPTYAVEVAWSRELSGVFTLDTSTLDGAHVLAGFSGGMGTVYDSITTDVLRVTADRGRQGDLTGVEQGKCTLVLKDSDGTYNPDNPSSPLNGYLVPMRPMRVRAWHGTTEYGIFRGFISKIEHNPQRDAQQTLIYGVDLMEWLNMYRPTIASTGATTVGAVIGLLLDAIGWSDPLLRDLDTGHALTDFSADGTKTVLTIIGELLAADLGLFFIDGDGRAVYSDTDRRYAADAAPEALTSTAISAARPGTDVTQIRNGWSVTRTGGTTQTATDATSRTDYGPRDGAAINSAYLVSDAQAGALANFLVMLYKDPTPPLTGMTLTNRDDTAIAQQLGLELGDLVTFSEPWGGTDITAYIVHIAHDISQAGSFHSVNMMLRKQTLVGFTLDVSLLDGANTLVY